MKEQYFIFPFLTLFLEHAHKSIYITDYTVKIKCVNVSMFYKVNYQYSEITIICIY